MLDALSPYLPVVALVAGALLAAAVLGWAGRQLRAWRGRDHVRRGQQAEREAERLLRRRGYAIAARQVTGSWELHVDGEPVQVQCRADLIVRRKRRTFVAEVKRGAGARVTAPGTRRQLLEYERAFAVDGVLLVDMRSRSVHLVTFPITPS